MLPQLKTRLESLENQEQQLQTREIDAEQQLRAEEVRLSDLRDQLERLDKALENASRRSGGTLNERSAKGDGALVRFGFTGLSTPLPTPVSAN